jgi:hypothetical protein
MTHSRVLAIVVVSLGGCTPILPFHLAETAEILQRREVSLTVAGGGGGASNLGNCCGGGAARVRVGLGHRMELGVDTELIGSGTAGSGSLTLGGKVSYKLGLLPYLALLAGVGATGSIGFGTTKNGEAGLGADVGLVASTPLIANRLRLYGGTRLSFVVPTAHDLYDAGGPTESLVVPVGLSIEPDRRWRIFLEGGYLGGFSQGHNGQPPMVFNNGWNGAYGALAVGYLWRGPS